MQYKTVFVIIVCSGLWFFSAAHKDKPLRVFAAASLIDVVTVFVNEYASQGQQSKINLGSSGTLARQILQGNPFDVYLSAHPRWMQHVDSLGFIEPGSIRVLASNELVVISPVSFGLSPLSIDSSLSLLSVLGDGRISMGDPAHVPAGTYAKQALDYYGLFEEISKQMLPAKDVRSALMIVEMGEAPLGIVYRTDAVKSKKVRIVGSFASYTHAPIAYVAGASPDSENAGQFLAFISSASSDSVWQAHGFIPLQR